MAAIIGGILALAGAGTQLYGARKGAKNAAKLSEQQNRLYGIQADLAERLSPYSMQFYKNAAGALGPALQNALAVTSNDRSRIMGAVAPGVRSIGDKYQSVTTANRELNRRGGASAAFNTELQYRAADDVQDLINRKRAAGWEDLLRISGLAGNLGASAAGQGVNAAMHGGNALNQMAATQHRTNQDLTQAYNEVGKAIIDMFGHDANSGWYVGNQPGKG